MSDLSENLPGMIGRIRAVGETLRYYDDELLIPNSIKAFGEILEDTAENLEIFNEELIKDSKVDEQMRKFHEKQHWINDMASRFWLHASKGSDLERIAIEASERFTEEMKRAIKEDFPQIEEGKETPSPPEDDEGDEEKAPETEPC